MKKNWVLRLGLLAMVLTLVTMPMVSSTYAKYVTSATGSDMARVAKWGVVMSTTANDIFGEAYGTNGAANSNVQMTRLDTPNAASISVNADTSDVENILAPGTQGSFTFSLTGKPEVAVNLSVASTITLSNNWEVNGFDYQPIKFTLKASDSTAGVYYNPLAEGTVKFNSAAIVYLTASQLQSAINSLTNAAVNPNTDLALISGATGATGTYTVTWEWPFFVDAVNNSSLVASPDGLSDLTSIVTTTPGVYYTYDQADTELGKIFLDPASDPTTLTINLTITATQIN